MNNNDLRKETNSNGETSLLINHDIPVIENEKIDTFRSYYQEFGLADYIRHVNNVDSRPDYATTFLKSIPDLSQLERQFPNIPRKKLMEIIDFSICSHKIVHLTFDTSKVITDRKTSGFVYLDSGHIANLILLANPLAPGKINLSTPTSTPEEQLRILIEAMTEAVKHAEDLFDNVPFKSKSQLQREYEDIIIESMKAQTHTGKTTNIEEDIDKSSHELKRRASDTDLWSNFKGEQQFDNNGIDWETCFRGLGPEFTCRLILRRKQFGILNQWLSESKNQNIPDISRILQCLTKARANALSGNSEFNDIDLKAIESLLNKIEILTLETQ